MGVLTIVGIAAIRYDFYMGDKLNLKYCFLEYINVLPSKTCAIPLCGAPAVGRHGGQDY